MRYRPSVVGTHPPIGCSWDASPMTLLWFVIWLICDIIGDEEPLTFDPVNWWAGSLLFVVAVDLAGVHARSAARG